jgi:hypothetical protein
MNGLIGGSSFANSISRANFNPLPMSFLCTLRRGG